MIRFLILLIFPLFLFAKVQITTYFPLESAIVKKIAQNGGDISEITHRYNTKKVELPESALKKLSNAKLFIYFGLDIEKEYAEVLKAKNPKIELVNLSLNIEKIGNNPYFWTDPFNLKIVAKTIFENLVKIDPRNINYYQKNLDKFNDEIDEVFLTVMKSLNKSHISSFFTLEEHLEYFAKRFRLEAITKDKKIYTTKDLNELETKYKDMQIKRVVYANQKDLDLVKQISKILDAKSLDIDIFDEDWQNALFELSDFLTR